MHKPQNREGRKLIWKNFEKFICAVGVTTILATFGRGLIWTHNNYWADPVIKCYEENESIEFMTDGDYRALKLRIYPQLVIRYNNKVLLQIHLKGYFENEFLQFDKNGKCSVQKQYEDYVGSLQRYIKEEIMSMVNNNGTKGGIKEGLYVYVSSVGGVSYVNNKGNIEKRYCIIEKDGIVIDYDVEDREIKNRLYETELEVGGYLNKIEDQDEVSKIVQEVSEKVITYYNS